jgi:NDP-sugar pyrophosphorylase family protein
LTEVRAKAALPVAGESMIRRVVAWLAESGVSEVTVNLHHLPETVAAELGDGSDLSVRARYSWEQPHVLGTAGGPRQALAIVGAETFLIVNGDTLTDVDLRALSHAHQTSGALVTLAVVPNRSPHRYGGVQVGPDAAVTAFTPPGHSAAYHFVGTQAVQAEAFRSLPAGHPAQSVGGLYNSLIAAAPGCVRAFLSDAAFLDVGTVPDYWATHWTLMESRGPAPRWTAAQSAARITRSILWEDVEVPPDCIVDECIVTDGVRVPPGARFRRTILLRGPGDSFHVQPFSP